jgi:hypothetical protein
MFRNANTHYASLGVGARGPCGSSLPLRFGKGYPNGVEAQLQSAHLASGVGVQVARLICCADELSELPPIVGRRRREGGAGPIVDGVSERAAPAGPRTVNPACETNLKGTNRQYRSTSNSKQSILLPLITLERTKARQRPQPPVTPPLAAFHDPSLQSSCELTNKKRKEVE